MSTPSWFDPKLSIGNVITIITVIVALVAGWFSFDTRLTLAEDRQERQVAADRETASRFGLRLDRVETDREDLRSRVIRIEEQLKGQDTKLDAILRQTAR